MKPPGTIRFLSAALVGVTLASSSARAQSAPLDVAGTVAAAAHMQEFNFGPNGDAESARLFLFPASFQRRLGSTVSLDGYAAYGVGTVKAAGSTFRLAGPVDSWLRVRWAANRWAVLAMGLALPTGLERHNADQAAVANTLSNDLLGFREGNWGGGGSATFGVSTFRQVGISKLTFGTSYKITRSFQPSSDTSSTYLPGNEAKVHVGVERPLRSGQFFTGFTIQHFGVDKADSRNLFQSGGRYRGDVSYARGNWNVFAADLWRARGDLTLPVIDALDNTFVRDTSFAVGWQNLAIIGASKSLAAHENFAVIGNADIKLRNKEELAGRGWLASAGITVPSRIGLTEIFPTFKFSRGSLAPAANPATKKGFWGMEISFVARRTSLRERKPVTN